MGVFLEADSDGVGIHARYGEERDGEAYSHPFFAFCLYYFYRLFY